MVNLLDDVLPAVTPSKVGISALALTEQLKDMIFRTVDC